MTNRTIGKLAVVLVAALVLAGCSDMSRQEQRMLSGGALGAAGGAVVTAVVGGPVLAGAAIGAVGGAAIGAMTK
jgi:hypothetical protein